MNRTVNSSGAKKGFSLLEVLISMVVIGVIGLLVFSLQTNSWKLTTRSNRTLVAGHMIEQQIEGMRMKISQDQINNFPPENGSLTSNGIDLKWTIANASRPTDGGNLPNVRKCDLTASWGTGKFDTLKATTYLSKMF